MCIAIAKLSGANLPPTQILKNCWDNNPDGAGFAYVDNGRVWIEKGFMDFEQFINELHFAGTMCNLKESSMLIHFRLASHGEISPDMTHPFPISSREEELRDVSYSTDYAVIHNGIIPITAKIAEYDIGLSDTAIYIKEILSRYKEFNNEYCKDEKGKQCDLLDNKGLLLQIEREIKSKMAILSKNGKIHLIENSSYQSFHFKDGCYYSNYSYMNTVSSHLITYPEKVKI